MLPLVFACCCLEPARRHFPLANGKKRDKSIQCVGCQLRPEGNIASHITHTRTRTGFGERQVETAEPEEAEKEIDKKKRRKIYKRNRSSPSNGVRRKGGRIFGYPTD